MDMYKINKFEKWHIKSKGVPLERISFALIGGRDLTMLDVMAVCAISSELLNPKFGRKRKLFHSLSTLYLKNDFEGILSKKDVET